MLGIHEPFSACNRRLSIHWRQLKITISESYIASRNKRNGKQPFLTSVITVLNNSTYSHWWQYRNNSDFRLTSVNQKRMCSLLCHTFDCFISSTEAFPWFIGVRNEQEPQGWSPWYHCVWCWHIAATKGFQHSTGTGWWIVNPHHVIITALGVKLFEHNFQMISTRHCDIPSADLVSWVMAWVVWTGEVAW